MQQHQSKQSSSLNHHDEEVELSEEFSLDLETLDVEELEQRLELQSIGVLNLFGGPGDTCNPDGCGWRGR